MPQEKGADTEKVFLGGRERLSDEKKPKVDKLVDKIIVNLTQLDAEPSLS